MQLSGCCLLFLSYLDMSDFLFPFNSSTMIGESFFKIVVMLMLDESFNCCCLNLEFRCFFYQTSRNTLWASLMLLFSFRLIFFHDWFFLVCIVWSQKKIYEQMRSKRFLWPVQAKHVLWCKNNVFLSSLEYAATFPLDLVRRRKQLEGAGGRAPVYTTGLFGIFKQIYQTEGFRGLYRGIMPEYYKVVPGVGICFMTYETLKLFLADVTPKL